MQRLATISIFTLLMTWHGATVAQETVIIGNPRPMPGIEIHYDALGPVRPTSTLENSRTPRGSKLPDLLPRNPANMKQARATSSQPLAPPSGSATAPVSLTPKPQPETVFEPPMEEEAEAPSPTPAARQLQPAAPPRPITPAKPQQPVVEAPIVEAPKAIEPPKMVAKAPEPVKPEAPVKAEPVAKPEELKFLPAPPMGFEVEKPQSAPQQPEQKVAAVAPATGAASKAIKHDALMFEPGSVDLSAEATAQLRALAARLAEGRDRIQLKSHASGIDDAAQARRLSLKRALAARSILIEGGIDSTRIDVRALGPVEDGGAADRIDMILLLQ